MPDYVAKEAEFVHGDMRSESDLRRALNGVQVIFHEAATGGFTANISRYVETNSLGTARMLELIREQGLPVQKIIVASSIAVYGEGKYRCSEHGVRYPELRPISQLEQGDWEVKCPSCGQRLVPLPIDETAPVSPGPPYSISKYDQERLVLNFGKAHSIPSVALRYFVTYGPRQSISNPYTGVCSIFSTRILNGLPPVVYEDGHQTRDFVFVEDVARANLLALDSKEADYRVLNVGTGRPISILSLAETLIRLYGKDLEPVTKGEFRPGDVRHIAADIGQIQTLGFEPHYSLEEGLHKYIEWIESKSSVKEYFSDAERALKAAGVVRTTRAGKV
jgi:dTDP-L-rhamnose 4-epimerase